MTGALGALMGQGGLQGRGGDTGWGLSGWDEPVAEVDAPFEGVLGQSTDFCDFAGMLK